MSFGDRLKAARKERGFSQEQLAEHLEVSRQSVTKWETGISFPEVKTLLSMASLLNRELDWLFYDEKEASIHTDDYYGTDTPPEAVSLISDRDTLNAAMKHDLLRELISTLDGFEIIRNIETEVLSGTQTCIFYRGRAYAETQGVDPQSKEYIQSFSEMDYAAVESLLLPWNSLRRSIVRTQPQVAEKAP